MSLLLWLPFTSHMNNQGVLNVEPTISDTQGTLNTNGKLGKCLKTGNDANINLNYIPDLNNGSLSFGGWFKFNQSEIAPVIEAQTYTSTYYACEGNLIGNDSYGGLGLIWETNNVYTSGSFSVLKTYAHIRTSTTAQNTNSKAITLDTWVHIFVVWNNDTRILSYYENGSLLYQKSVATFTDAVSRSFMINKKSTAGGNFNNVSLPFYLNDLRVYDNAVSAKEIKEISKGLVCHYQLNDVYSTNNLIPNGYGQDGSKGWSNGGDSYMSTTEIPSVAGIKASYFNYNETDYIPFVHNTTYTISMYIKAKSTSGSSYPSLRPYDVDKKFIDYYKSQGINQTYKATLVQPLHKGDTVIYADDLSAWTTDTTTHYYRVAIFGYKDSQGTVYPDFEYTQDAPSFGTRTDKSNIDKTNNTITLLAPYTGEDRPAGTKICQSTEGSTYYYPFGGINVTTVTDWTLKTTTFNTDNSRLRHAKYIRFLAYGGLYYAGIKLTDNSNTPKVYDCSGYGYDGVVNGDLISSLDTPRLRRSTFFGSIANNVQTSNPTFLGSLTNATICWWENCNDANNKLIFWGGSTYQYICAGSATLRLYDRNIGSSGISFYIDGVLQTTTYDANNTIRHEGSFHVQNEWHFMCLTGINLSGWTQFLINGYSSNYPTNSRISDVRVYATPLSADDVKALYEAPESISNTGAMFTQGEFVEL